MKEAVLVLATIAQRWSFRAGGPAPRPEAGWTLAPKGGLRMVPVPRP
jgi:hypothetical protein